MDSLRYKSSNLVETEIGATPNLKNSPPELSSELPAGPSDPSDLSLESSVPKNAFENLVEIPEKTPSMSVPTNDSCGDSVPYFFVPSSLGENSEVEEVSGVPGVSGVLGSSGSFKSSGSMGSLGSSSQLTAIDLSITTYEAETHLSLKRPASAMLGITNGSDQKLSDPKDSDDDEESGSNKLFRRFHPSENNIFDADGLKPPQKIRLIAQHVYLTLPAFGFAIVDNLLGSERANDVFYEVEKLYSQNKFSDGQLVKASDEIRPKLIRSDMVLWWDKTVAESPAIQFLVSKLDTVIYSCTGHLPPYKLDGKTRAMIACYPAGGSHYVRHVDNPEADGRLITAIYYLNSDWKPEDGGTLKMYPASCTQSVEVAPMMDRLLMFWSDRRTPHEVLPSFRIRYAITVWYFEADEKARAMERDRQKKFIQQEISANSSSKSLESIGEKKGSVDSGFAAASNSSIESSVLNERKGSTASMDRLDVGMKNL